MTHNHEPTTEELNLQLYEKLEAEFAAYRAELLTLPAEEIDDLKEAIHLKPPTGYFNELIVIQRQDSLTIREVSYRYIQSAEPDGLFYIAIQEEKQV